MPSRGRKIQVVETHSESEEESQDDPVVAAKKIIEAGKARRETRRQVIQAEHKAHVKELGNRIEKVYAVRKTKVTDVNQALLGRFNALNSKRENLEKLILTSMKTTELSTRNMQSEIVAMLYGRLEDIEDTPLPIESPAIEEIPHPVETAPQTSKDVKKDRWQ